VANVYFELTREFNRSAPVAALASGQAVVYYRVAIMSKDGDWVIREDAEACAAVLTVLGGRGARYRPSAPLDVRWLAGGWSSHFEFADDRGRRVRCDFVSRPPRVPSGSLARLFDAGGARGDLLVVDPETLVRMKQTQRAKDYPPIGEIARLLPPEQELAYTTDPDRILALAPLVEGGSRRPSVEAARATGNRDSVVVALAREIDAMQQRDRARVSRYLTAAGPYLQAFRDARLSELPLHDAHAAACALAEQWLPARPASPEDGNADAER
jgi:hypothetical protein